MRVKKTGLVAQPKDDRDLFYQDLRGGGEWEEMITQLKDRLVLNFNERWLYNQKKTSDCVFFGSAVLGSKLFNTRLSPSYLARFGKKISNLSYGAYTIDGVKALKSFGSCNFNLFPEKLMNRDSDKFKIKITDEMQKSANEHKSIGYCRVDGLFGNKFDNIRLFIQETNSPCIVTLDYYSSYNGTKNGGEFIRTKYAKRLTGHIVACIGWEGDHYIFVDSFLRIVKMHKSNMVGISYGLLDFQREKIKPLKKQITRDLDLEKQNALILRGLIYSDFGKKDQARVSAFHNWFKLINAKTYHNYTFRDLINWIYNFDRHGTELFDLAKDRSETIE